MTEAEINLAIAKLEYPNLNWFSDGHLAVNWKDGCMTEYDYLHWADIGPIIECEKLTLGCNDTYGTYFAHDGYGNFTAFAETPTKAAALCYLKMKGVE